MLSVSSSSSKGYLFLIKIKMI